MNICIPQINAAINSAAAPQSVALASADVPLPSMLVSAGPEFAPYHK
ncbi:hypothetical protein ACLB1R_31150 [Escherichia coli]